MRHTLLARFSAASLLLGAVSLAAQSHTDAGADPVPDVTRLLNWKQCREYPTHDRKDRGCRVDFNMTQTADGTLPAQTHRDITVPLGPETRAVVALWHSSPFAACTLTTSPGPLARDLSANVGAALAGLAGFGGSLGSFLEGNQAHAEAPSPDALAEERFDIAPASQEILDEEKAIKEALQKFNDDARPYEILETEREEAAVIKKNLHYSYPNDKAARGAINTIEVAAEHIVSATVPDIKLLTTLRVERNEVAKKIESFTNKHQGDQSVQSFLHTADKQLGEANRKIDETPSLLGYVKDLQDNVQKLLNFLNDFKARENAAHAQGSVMDPSVQVLPIALYPESKVGVTVKCADAITGTALPDSIQFNAYFQRAPQFDLSSGVLISSVKGRQAELQTPYSDPAAAPSCTAATATAPAVTSGCPVVVIRTARPQFMPGVFAEWHPVNFKLPGVHDTADAPKDPRTAVASWMSEKVARHPLGYVGSLGLAAGFMVNPNNGSAQAEFFEGISFGMQRFVFLVGNHNGRSQNLAPGYTEGAPVAAGTTVPTVSNWSNGLAFGVTYRIPLR